MTEEIKVTKLDQQTCQNLEHVTCHSVTKSCIGKFDIQRKKKERKILFRNHIGVTRHFRNGKQEKIELWKSDANCRVII